MKIPSTSTAMQPGSPFVMIVPSPGYSVGNYEPLFNLRSPATPKSLIPSPPRKRRQLQVFLSNLSDKCLHVLERRSRNCQTLPS